MNFTSVLEALVISGILDKVPQIRQKIVRDGSFHPVKKRYTSIFEAVNGVV